MSPKQILELLEQVSAGTLTPDDGLKRLKHLPFEDLGYARVDHHRTLRVGFPEVVFGKGKTPEQIAGIVKSLLKQKTNILVTRTDEDAWKKVRTVSRKAEFNPLAQAITIVNDTKVYGDGIVYIVCAGTSDIPVAEEAALTARLMGNEVRTSYDVGVAGIHRLLNIREALMEASVVVAVAGMEGALASVVGGLLSVPVIAVPTSIGYGSNFGGLSALLTMLNSCASNVVTVNIDNGFGGGYVAGLINRKKDNTRDENRSRDKKPQ